MKLPPEIKEKPSAEEWVEEFQAFVSAQEAAPPASLTDRIRARVHADLNPSAWKIFSKMSAIHAVTGTATLMLCPQFGVSPLTESMGLMALFMKWGDTACMVGCGAFFLGSSALVASLTFRPEEIKVMRRTEPLQIGMLGLASISVFVCLGVAAIEGLALAWLFGSIVGGVAALELGWLIRRRLRYGW